MSSINTIICRYLYKEWIEPHKSQRAFATDHNIEESTVRKIKRAALNEEEYAIPIFILNRICEARNMKLSILLSELKY